MSENGQHDHLGFDPETGFADTGSAQADAPAAQDLSSLKQVREILVGPLSSELEGTVRELDKRLDVTVKEISESSDKRIAAMEDKLQSELERMGDEMDGHRNQDRETFEGLERETTSGFEELRRSAKELTEEMAKATEDFRSELGKIREQVDRLVETVSNRLDDECLSLRAELVDRASLSAALSEVALRLAGTSGAMHEIDPDRPDIDIDHLLDG